MSEKTTMPKTKRESTRGKVVKLHKYWKGIATTIQNKADRRHYLNMMLDATVSEHEAKMKKRKDKDDGGDE